VVYQDKMFLYGGSNLDKENTKFFSLDLNSHKWEVINSRGDVPQTRDDHTALLFETEQCMIVFGGFVNGAQTNEIYKYFFQENKWQKVVPQGVLPPPRVGHSAVIYRSSMVVFGGRDEENNKMSDLWIFDIPTSKWTEVECSEQDVPLARSGHSCAMYGEYMLLFGGIYEITKELNDLHMFDLANRRWIMIFEESNSPKRMPSDMALEEKSPARSPGQKNQSFLGQSTFNERSSKSPPKANSRNARGTKATMPKATIKKRLNLPGAGNSPASRNKGPKLPNGAQFLAEFTLSTPTSVSMQNSFIIKNADQSFDHYYAQMKKRKQQGASPHNNNQATANASFLTATSVETSYGKTKGKRPAARDGHTGIVYGDYFFVFGGDRHHMPFNDTFVLDLKAEMSVKSFLF